MKSEILEFLENINWDIDELLSSRANKNLVIIELARMEGYIMGLIEQLNSDTEEE